MSITVPVISRGERANPLGPTNSARLGWELTISHEYWTFIRTGITALKGARRLSPRGAQSRIYISKMPLCALELYCHDGLLFLPVQMYP